MEFELPPGGVVGVVGGLVVVPDVLMVAVVSVARMSVLALATATCVESEAALGTGSLGRANA